MEPDRTAEPASAGLADLKPIAQYGGGTPLPVSPPPLPTAPRDGGPDLRSANELYRLIRTGFETETARFEHAERKAARSLTLVVALFALASLGLREPAAALETDATAAEWTFAGVYLAFYVSTIVALALTLPAFAVRRLHTLTINQGLVDVLSRRSYHESVRSLMQAYTRAARTNGRTVDRMQRALRRGYGALVVSLVLAVLSGAAYLAGGVIDAALGERADPARAVEPIDTPRTSIAPPPLPGGGSERSLAVTGAGP